MQPRNGFEIKAGDHISDVRILVSYGNSKIDGLVKLENGTLPDNARIIVRVNKVGETTSPALLRPPQVDTRGHFIIEGLPGGNYEIVANILGPGSPVSRAPSGRQQISLADDQVAAMTITIDLGQKPGP